MDKWVGEDLYRDEGWVAMWNKLRKWFECRGSGWNDRIGGREEEGSRLLVLVTVR